MSKNQTRNKENISRKDALKKMGTYAAFAALGTMTMLNPQKAQALSLPDDPGSGFGAGNGARSVRRNKNKK